MYASLMRGGPLHLALEELLADAQNLAMDAFSLEGDDRGDEWPADPRYPDTIDHIAHEVADAMFGEALASWRLRPSPPDLFPVEAPVTARRAGAQLLVI